tara:strand:- start:27 stop:914 length:888 start_codon:yes stop_codon:yes gene_type:complete
MDVVFCIDYSGSMGTAINNIKTSIAQIVQTIKDESLGDYRLGLVIFDARNYAPLGTDPGTAQSIKYAKSPLVPQFPTGTGAFYNGALSGGSIPNTWNDLPAAQKVVTTRSDNPNNIATPPAPPAYIGVYQILTAMEVMSDANEATFTTQLNILNDPTNFPIGGGAISQGPEPGDLAIEQIIDNDFAGAFRNNVAKVIITISDNYPGGYTENYSQVALNPNPVIDRLEALKTTSINEKIQHLVMIKLDSLTIKDPKPMAADTGYRILLEGTDGVFVNSFDPTDIIQAIKDLCIINA